MTNTTATKKGTKFIYVTYIRTTQQKLWDALLMPEFTKQYWRGCYHVCDWTKGAKWELFLSDGVSADSGEVLEIDPPNKLVVHWKHTLREELLDEPASKLTFTLEDVGEIIKLTVVHESQRDESKLIDAVSKGWPAILSSLKSLLECGKAHPGEAATSTAVCNIK
ncbi:MAG TPA: SRPBCC family protein [Oculatellaceae cyanobacterium]